MEKDKVKKDETIESIDIMRKRDALQTTWAKVNIFFCAFIVWQAQEYENPSFYF